MDSDSLSGNRSRLGSGLAIPLIRANRLHHRNVPIGSRTKSECRQLLVWHWFPLKVRIGFSLAAERIFACRATHRSEPDAPPARRNPKNDPWAEGLRMVDQQPFPQEGARGSLRWISSSCPDPQPCGYQLRRIRLRIWISGCRNTTPALTYSAPTGPTHRAITCETDDELFSRSR